MRLLLELTEQTRKTVLDAMLDFVPIVGIRLDGA